MDFVYTNVVLAVVLLVAGIIFLFWKNKWANITSGLLIIFVLFNLGLPDFLLVVLTVIVSFISLNYVFSKKAYAGVFLFGALLVISLLSSSVYAAPPVDNPGHGIPNPVDNPGNGIPNFVRHVGMITNQPELSVSGTDYVVGDSGKLQAYLTVGSYPVSTAACYISVLYPNMTFFIDNNLMLSASFAEHFEGLYYLDFVVPNSTGVYPVNAYCYYNASSNFNNVSGVVVPNTSFVNLEDHDNYFLMDSIDNNYYRVKDKGACNNINCSVLFNFTLPIGWYNSLLSDSRLLFNGKLDDNKDDIYFYVLDGNNRYYWFNIIDKNIVFNEQFVINSTFEDNTNIVVEAEAFDWDNSKLSIDQLVITRVYNGSYVGDLRGNDELVVSKGITDIFNESTGSQDIIDLSSLFTILLLIIACAFLFTGFPEIGGLLFIAWGIISQIDILIKVLVIVIGVLIMYNGFKKKR